MCPGFSPARECEVPERQKVRRIQIEAKIEDERVAAAPLRRTKSRNLFVERRENETRTMKTRNENKKVLATQRPSERFFMRQQNEQIKEQELLLQFPPTATFGSPTSQLSILLISTFISLCLLNRDATQSCDLTVVC